MTTKPNRKLAILTLAIIVLTAAVSAGLRQADDEFNYAWGPLYTANAPAPAPDQTDDVFQIAAKSARKQLVRWNRISIDASGLDHTPVAPGENRVFGEQLGPGRASRAVAIVHIAMFEALNAL